MEKGWNGAKKAGDQYEQLFLQGSAECLSGVENRELGPKLFGVR